MKVRIAYVTVLFLNITVVNIKLNYSNYLSLYLYFTMVNNTEYYSIH